LASEDVCLDLELHKETLHCLRSRFFNVSERVYKEYYDLYWDWETESDRLTLFLSSTERR